MGESTLRYGNCLAPECIYFPRLLIPYGLAVVIPMNTNHIAMSKKKSILKPRTKKQEAQINQDINDLAYFLYWKRKYYEKELEGQDLIDLQRASL